MSQLPLILYYDGLCPLCSREIAHYRSRVHGEEVTFIDITDPAFDASTHGVEPRRVHKVMHARRGESLLTGLDAFIALWETVPGYAWLARLARLPVLYGILNLGYHIFALLRPLLPRRKLNCDTGTCGR
jgi:predicted DCC family thiol-disulfide oxidoreductase YuxK